MIERLLKVTDAQEESVFLFGARQTGKTTLLLHLFPDNRFYDLLETDTYERLRRNPSLLRQELADLKEGEIVIIDEIQLIPELLNEVHWLITRQGIHFILSGSSARKLKRKGHNTLGGRALPVYLFPFVSAEIPDLDIDRAVSYGMIPPHYLAENPSRHLTAYIQVYLKEEIKEEALVRNLTSFQRFLEVAALTDGEIINNNNIAQDCGVSATTVSSYFDILEDTLIGYRIPAFRKAMKRRLVQSPRFYYFDVGVANHLRHRKDLVRGTDEYGHAFEHLVVQEIYAWLHYSHSEEEMSYWRTYTGTEVDVVIGEARVAIEIKSAEEVQSRHLKGLKAFAEEYPKSRRIIVSLDRFSRKMGDVECIYVKDFFSMLWNEGL